MQEEVIFPQCRLRDACARTLTSTLGDTFRHAPEDVGGQFAGQRIKEAAHGVACRDRVRHPLGGLLVPALGNLVGLDLAQVQAFVSQCNVLPLGMIEK